MVGHIVRTNPPFGEWIGEHTGPLTTPAGELAPTGRTVRVPFATLVRIRDGRIASARTSLDQLAFTTQLGLVPEPAANV
jgi:hypothetical protein